MSGTLTNSVQIGTKLFVDRWITIRIDVLGNALSTVLAAYLTYVARISASEAGFALTMAGAYWGGFMRTSELSCCTVGFSSFILGWMRMFNDFQVMGRSRLVFSAVNTYPDTRSATQPTAWNGSSSTWSSSRR